MTNPRNLKKLIELQKLGSARLEQALAAANARKGALEEERAALIAMQDRRYVGDALNIDPSLLIRRLGNNAAESQQLEQRLDVQRKALLQEQRRVELLEDRLTETRNERDRRELSTLIEEFISRKTTNRPQGPD